MEVGANINEQDANGDTLLFKAIRNKPFWAKEYDDIKAFVERGACLAARDFKGRTVLHEAIKHHQSRDSSNTVTKGIKTTRFDYFVSRGLDVHATDYSGNTLLHEMTHPYPRNVSALFSPRRIPLWKQLMSLGVDVNQRNNQGRTPLHMLYMLRGENPEECGNIEVLDFVLSTAKDIDVQDRDGLTPYANPGYKLYVKISTDFVPRS
jgi:ankyrin repeat protein